MSSKVGLFYKKNISTVLVLHAKDLPKLKESAILWLVFCFLATSIMGVEEAPTAPAAPTGPSMGVTELTATPLEEIMVCVVGVEEPSFASVGVNIYALAPGRAEDSDFSSWPRTISVGRWRNISGQWLLIGLVFVVIVQAIELTLGTLATAMTPSTSAPEIKKAVHHSPK